MSGTNPDGSPYKDPGIKWVSYFNGATRWHKLRPLVIRDPQSTDASSCHFAASAEIYPYTPIGTLVTIET